MQGLRTAGIAAVWVALVAAAFAGAAEPHTGRVTHVVDGHSVDVLVKAQRVRVRLAGINAPRAGEPYGLRSRQSLVRLCAGEIASVDATVRAGDGSLVGRVACAGTDAGAEQLRLGMARVSAGAGADLYAIESQARAAHRGVWSTQTPGSPSRP